MFIVEVVLVDGTVLFVNSEGGLTAAPERATVWAFESDAHDDAREWRQHPGVARAEVYVA